VRRCEASAIALSACLLCLASACENTLDPSSRLTNLRLLAVEADKPAAEPGETVSLRALYANNDDASLQWGYALCDGASSSAALDCLRALDPSSLQVAPDQTEFSFTMPEPSAQGKRPVSIGVAVIVCPGQIVSGDSHGIPLACEVAGKPLDINDFEMGVKRIFYTDQSPNQNPSIAAITLDGEPWPADALKTITACTRDTEDVADCKAPFRHTLKVEPEEDAVESFIDNDGKRVNEQVVAQFYATGGTFEYDVRTIDAAETRFIAQKSDVGKTLTLHFVIRDSRGGVSWQTRTLSVSSD
jgi:hypothetical protein